MISSEEGAAIAALSSNGFGFVKYAGFTLAELVIVILVLGTIAVVAIPRLGDTDEFKRAGFHEELKATLRAAQKTAVAQRRRVEVSVASAGVTTGWCAVAPGTDACLAPTAGCTGTLIGPTGSALGASAPVGTTIAPSLVFRFDCLGRPMETDTQPLPTTVFALSGGRTVTVTAETGYVH